MKTPFSSAACLYTASAILSIGLAAVANAGPGIDYWRRMDQMKTDRQAVATAAMTHTAGCSDARTVAVIEVHKDWANGRGPAHFVQIGNKQVCRSCGVATTVSQTIWANGKGTSKIKAVSSEHTCTSACQADAHS